jgi:membrane protease YdiL (CAAX protease family)
MGGRQRAPEASGRLPENHEEDLVSADSPSVAGHDGSGLCGHAADGNAASRSADPGLDVPILGLGFAVGAAGEELGWQGYAFAPLQNRWNAVEAAIVVGVVWGAWHMVPFAESHRSTAWIVWQTLGMIPFRVLIVWLFNNTGRSVFAAIVFHATSNVSQFLFPNYGSHYDPFIPGLILALTAAGVTLLWGPETLARYRFGWVRSSSPRGGRQ